MNVRKKLLQKKEKRKERKINPFYSTKMHIVLFYAVEFLIWIGQEVSINFLLQQLWQWCQLQDRFYNTF